jgi:hypothetical protein
MQLPLTWMLPPKAFTEANRPGVLSNFSQRAVGAAICRDVPGSTARSAPSSHSPGASSRSSSGLLTACASAGRVTPCPAVSSTAFVAGSKRASTGPGAGGAGGVLVASRVQGRDGSISIAAGASCRISGCGTGGAEPVSPTASAPPSTTSVASRRVARAGVCEVVMSPPR